MSDVGKLPYDTTQDTVHRLTVQRDDLVMLLRRMLWASAVENDGRGLGLIRLNAVDYLRRHGLSGKVTRENMHKDPKDLDPSRSSAIRRNGGDSGSDAKPPKGEVTQSWPRANQDELELFDEATKECTMNCGPHVNDPRTTRERKFLCEDCLDKEKKCK